jgi:hypothetical protein
MLPFCNSALPAVWYLLLEENKKAGFKYLL